MIIIIGNGGHASVLKDILALRGHRFTALEKDDDILLHDPAKVKLANGIGGTRDTTKREAVYHKFLTRGYLFERVIHPSAVIASNVMFGHGVQVMAGVVIQPGVWIGGNSIINTRASIDHDCSVGQHVHIAPGVVLSGGVRIGDCTHIGTGASVIQGIKIGKGALVAAGATVYRDIEDGIEYIKAA